MEFDPTQIRLSPNFLLSDFLGNHTVYSRGLPNTLEYDDPELPLKLVNARALCESILEPLLAQAGPMSISYGYIRPTTSDQIVAYQDPRKPSHHQFNLGAAADICIHEWTNHDPDDDTTATAPITLAHEMHDSGYPYSRLITYSESPYLCVAASAAEIAGSAPRLAFYENKYCGIAKEKPQYKSLATESAKARNKAMIADMGLAHGWRGSGYPTYHGGGRRQYHHIRVSKYTMLSDWLFDLQSIANGYKNIPKLNDPETMNALRRAGEAYDYLIKAFEVNRLSIISGYLSETNPTYEDGRSWKLQAPVFRVSVPENTNVNLIVDVINNLNNGPIAFIDDLGGGVIEVEVR